MKVTFLQYNVDQAMREERVPHLTWNVRMPKTTELIKKASPDLINLNEMRKLPNSNLSVPQYLVSFEEYDNFLAYRNPTELAFGQAILWKRKDFFATERVVRWLSKTPTIPSDDNPTGRGTILLGVKLFPVFNGEISGEPFWVFNSHFPMGESDKTHCCRMLVKLLPEIAGKDR